MQKRISQILESITGWAFKEGFEGVLLVGSQAHGTAQPDSDIDVVILVADYSKWFTNNSWTELFGKIEKSSFEDWGGVKTIRAFYQNGQEIEFNFAIPSWASINPVDAGTFRVVADGAKILYDPTQRLNDSTTQATT